MKKVRIEIKETSSGRRFWLFPSSSELYEWVLQCIIHPESASDTPSQAEEIILYQNQFLEVEWLGCEILHLGKGYWYYLNLVRLGKSSETNNAAGNVVSTASGWVVDTIIPMKNYDDENIIVTRVDAGPNSYLDLEKLCKHLPQE